MSSKPQKLFVRPGQIYILPTGHGMTMLIGVVVMILTAATYNNNLIYLLAFFVFSLLLVSLTQTHRNLRNIKVLYPPFAEGYAGQNFPVTFRVVNQSDKSKESINLSFYYKPPDLNVDLENVQHIELIESGGGKSIVLHAGGKHRGLYMLPGLKVSTVYPLGFFRAWMLVDIKSKVYIYPQLKGNLPLPVAGQGEGNLDTKSAQALLGEEGDFKEHRVWRVGESDRHVDWKVFARSKKKMTKVFNKSQDLGLQFFYQRIMHLEPEDRLSQLSLWIYESNELGVAFELNMPGQIIPLAKGEEHVRQCLRTLAVYQESN